MNEILKCTAGWAILYGFAYLALASAAVMFFHLIFVKISYNFKSNKVRIVEVAEGMDKYFIVESRILFFFWQGVGTDMSTWRFKTLEEAEKCAKEFMEHSVTKKVVFTK